MAPVWKVIVEDRFDGFRGCGDVSVGVADVEEASSGMGVCVGFEEANARVTKGSSTTGL